jgi:hypothetical protein
MADAANDDSVGAAIRPPQYRKAVQDIRGRIEPKRDKVSSINGEIADAWAKIEGLGCNKIGAKIFQKLDQLEPDERADVLRTIQGMISVSEWPELNDLVDQAEGNTASYNLVGGGSEEEEDEPEEEPEGKPAKKSRAEALAASKRHLGGGGKAPDAMDGAPTVQ